MRGALFIGGNAPDISPGKKVLGPVDMVIAADSGLITAEAWGMNSDWIVGDMDSLDSLQRLEKYPRERVVRYSEDKDYTDTELGLELLRQKGCNDITIVGGGGGRLDHVMAIQALFERPLYPARWLPGSEVVHCLDSSDVKTGALDVCVSANDIISVFPVAQGPWKIQSSGLKWPLADLDWDRGSIGVSNRATGPIRLNVLQGRFLIIVPL